MYDVADILKAYNETGSIRGVQRKTNISRNTIAKYLVRVEENRADQSLDIIRSKQRARYKRTDELIELINTLLEENKEKPLKLRYTAKKVWRIVVSRGYDVGYSSVKRVVKLWKDKSNPTKDVYIEQIPKEGARAEFDWGYVPLVIDGQAGLYPVAFMVLNKSLYRYACIFEQETQLEVIQSHIDFFNEIGGVPKTIFYDNLKAVVDRPKKVNENFLKFASFFGFAPNICNPHAPNEKGTDEETVGMVRNYCFSEKNDFKDIDEANAYLKTKLSEINSMHVYKRELAPKDGLINEQDFLNPLPSSCYNNYYLAVRNISKYSTVSFETNHYSIPDTFFESKVMLKVYPDKIEIVGFNEDVTVATHKRLFTKNNYALDITHYLETIKRKPRAFANSRALETLNATLKALFDRYYSTNPKDFIEILSLAKSYEDEHLEKSIKALMQSGVIPTLETIKNFLEQKDMQQTESFYYPGINIDTVEPCVYDSLLEASCN